MVLSLDFGICLIYLKDCENKVNSIFCFSTFMYFKYVGSLVVGVWFGLAWLGGFLQVDLGHLFLGL